MAVFYSECPQCGTDGHDAETGTTCLKCGADLVDTSDGPPDWDRLQAEAGPTTE